MDMRCSVSGRLGRYLNRGQWAAVTQRTLLNLSELCGCDQSVHHLAFEQTWKRAEEDDKGPERESLLFPPPNPPGFSVLYTLWLMFRPSLLMIILLRLSTDLLNVFGPFTLRWVILFCERQPVFDWEGYIYALAVLGTAISYTISQRLLEYLSKKTAVTAQVTLTDAIYRKTLSLPSLALVLSNLVERILEILVALSRLGSSPLRAGLCFGILWWQLGAAMLVGGLVLLLLAPVCSKLERRIRLEKCSLVTFRKHSENLLKELFHGIKALKLLALETYFQHKVAEAWERELETLTTLGYLAAFSVLSHICLPFLVCVSSLGVFVLMDDGNVLTPSQVFMCLCFFRMLRSAYLELFTLPFLLRQLRESLIYLEEIFLIEDLDMKNSLSDLLNVNSKGLEILSLINSQQHCNRCDDRKNSDPERQPEQLPAYKGIVGELRQYLRVFGWYWILLALLTQLGLCVISVAQDGLLCMWTGEAKDVQGLEEWKEIRDSRLTIYTLLGLVQALLVCWVACSLCHGSLQASQSLRTELLSSVLRLPLSVHLNTDHTQLLYTFADQGLYVIDDHIPKHLHTWGSCLVEIISTVLLITCIIPVYSLLVCPLIFIFLSVQSHFSSAQRQIRQTVVSSEVSLCLLHQLQALRQNLQVHYSITTADRWALLRLDAVGVMSLFFISLVLLENIDSSDSGSVALALAYGFYFRELMHQYTKTTAEIGNHVSATQRIGVYTSIEKEAAWTGSYPVPPDWPQNGELEFRNLVVEECSMSPAFNVLNFCISKGEKLISLKAEVEKESVLPSVSPLPRLLQGDHPSLNKIGVVSRDKSETDGLIACLFRAVEAESGSVCIDGVDIARLGLHTLRRRLHLIPQEPVMLSGSLRANLDPFGRYSDAQVWQALELCQLKKGAGQLSHQILHQGTPCSTAHRREDEQIGLEPSISLSAPCGCCSLGQKRLVYLARALLFDARLLLVENAHLTGDSEMEKLLQHLILTELSECTVLWLSQNPISVMHTERVLVLDGGHAVEFDSPSNLLQQGTVFRKLLQDWQNRGHD